jgi:hypothetical protein
LVVLLPMGNSVTQNGVTQREQRIFFKLISSFPSFHIHVHHSSSQIQLSFEIIISLLQSTAGHRPLQCLAISLDLRLLASISSRPAQIVTPPGLRASYTTFTETRSPLQKSFTPAVIGSFKVIKLNPEVVVIKLQNI